MSVRLVDLGDDGHYLRLANGQMSTLLERGVFMPAGVFAAERLVYFPDDREHDFADLPAGVEANDHNSIRVTSVGVARACGYAAVAHGAGWVRASELGSYSDVMRRTTTQREARLGIAGYGRSPASEVADAATEVLDGARVRTVPVGAASGGAGSIEDAEDAIYAATWGRPVTGYVVGLGREMVVKQVPRCP